MHMSVGLHPPPIVPVLVFCVGSAFVQDMSDSVHRCTGHREEVISGLLRSGLLVGWVVVQPYHEMVMDLFDLFLVAEIDVDGLSLAGGRKRTEVLG